MSDMESKLKTHWSSFLHVIGPKFLQWKASVGSDVDSDLKVQTPISFELNISDGDNERLET